MTGPGRAVEVLHDRGPLTTVAKRWAGGSGYLIGGRLVLTAAHAVGWQQDLATDEQLLVRTVSGNEFAARVVLAFDELSAVDLALLEINDPRFNDDFPPVTFAAISRDGSAPITRCWAVGFPRLAEADPVLPEGSRRDTWHVWGDILPGGKLRAGVLSLQVTSAPQPIPPELAGSAWEGMSGAVVFATDPDLGESAVGVVSAHHGPEGSSALTLVPVTAVAAQPTAALWWHELNVADSTALPSLPRQPSSPTDHKRTILRGYLEAAKQASDEHPYSLALPSAPSLATVYLRQELAQPDDGERAKQRAGRAEARVSQSEAATPEQSLSINEALERNRCALVMGGPGAGKSSLLRHLTGTVAARWLDGTDQPFVPVRVLAHTLTSSHLFPDILNESVIADLGATVGELPKNLFASEALPGIPWLVLVDGLDEITDLQQRQRAVRVLARWWNDPAYRFLVATRPLPGEELSLLRSARASTFTIQPFDRDQLPELASRWFAALHADNVPELTGRFLNHLEQSRLGELAVIPLIATLACLVFVAEQNVPPSRFGLYNAFVTELLEDPGKRDDLIEQLNEQARPYHAEIAVLKLVQDRRSLLEYIAYAYEGETEGASGIEKLRELAKNWTENYKPDEAPDSRWADMVVEAVRQSGLMIQRGNGFTFFHQTMQEYLAACHRAAIFRPTRRRATRNLALHNLSVWSDWDDPPTPALFLAAAWMAKTGQLPHAPHTVRPYRRLTFYLFAAALARDGVALPSHSVERAIRQLTYMAGSPWWARWWMSAAKAWRYRRWYELLAWRYNRVHAARGLVLLDRERGAAALTMLAADPALTAAYARLEAAKALTALDRVRGAEALAALAADATFDDAYRPDAAQQLAEFDPVRARQVIETMTDDPTLPPWIRSNSAIDLAWLDHSYDTATLISIATDVIMDSHARSRAAAGLAREASQQAAQALAAYALDSTINSYDRIDAANGLIEIGPEQAIDVLTTLAADPTMEHSYARMLAARALAPLDAERGAHALTELAHDPKADSDDRRTAAVELAELDPIRGVPELRGLVADRTMKRIERLRAWRAARAVEARRRSSQPHGRTTADRPPGIGDNANNSSI